MLYESSYFSHTQNNCWLVFIFGDKKHMMVFNTKDCMLFCIMPFILKFNLCSIVCFFLILPSPSQIAQSANIGQQSYKGVLPGAYQYPQASVQVSSGYFKHLPSWNIFSLSLPLPQPHTFVSKSKSNVHI